MLCNTQKNKSGFTLIELLLYIAVSAMMLLAISVFLAEILESRVKNQTVAEVEQQGMQAMLLMTQTIRNAQTISTPSAGNNTPSATLDVLGVEGASTVFDLVDGVLRIVRGGDEAVPLTNTQVTVSDVAFRNLSRSDTSGTIRIEFTLTHHNPSNRQEYSYQKTFVGSATLR